MSLRSKDKCKQERISRMISECEDLIISAENDAKRTKEILEELIQMRDSN